MTLARRTAAAALVLAAVLAPPAALAFGNANAGDRIQDATLRSIDGKRQAMLDPQRITLFAFVRPGQWQSLKTLQILSELQREFATRPIRIVAVVSDSARPDERRALAQVAAPVPLLVDAGDRLSGAIGAFTHPSIGFADRDHRLISNEVFTTVNLRDALRERIEALVPPPAPGPMQEAPKPPPVVVAAAAAPFTAAATPTSAPPPIAPARPPAAPLPVPSPAAERSAEPARATSAPAQDGATGAAAPAPPAAATAATGLVVVHRVLVQHLEPVGVKRDPGSADDAPALPPVADPEE